MVAKSKLGNRKAASKQPDKAVKPGKVAAKKKVSAPGKRSLQDVMDRVNAKAKSHVMGMANDEDYGYLLRRPTGITSLDIKLAGGWPESSPNVLVGPDGVGKDYLLWKTCAELQKNYGKETRILLYFTEFLPDKEFMRFAGFKVAFTEAELDEIDLSRDLNGKPALSAEERAEKMEQIGEISIIVGEVAEVAFDAIQEALESGVCQLIAVNSIGCLQTAAKEQVESFEEFAQQRNEASLLSKVMPKFSLIQNRRLPDGTRNETTLIYVNQVRSKDASRGMPGRPQQEKDTYKPGSASRALKHGKAIELSLHKGKAITTKETFTLLGREINWETSKGKLGVHDGIKGTFNFFFNMGADVAEDLVNTAVGLGVIEASGSWYAYDSMAHQFSVQGVDKAVKAVRESQEMYDEIRAECFKKSAVICRVK